MDTALNNLTLPQQDKAAERLRQERNSGPEAENSGGGSSSFRERVMRARQALNLKNKMEEKVAAPAKAGTSKLLANAWRVLIPSWGLSFIWINIHVFLKSVFGEKLFCKLGDEWMPKQVQAAGGEAGKMAGKGVRTVELIVWLFINTILFCVIIFIVSFFVDENTSKTMQGEKNNSPASITAPQ
jgi:hypothetical protein